MKLQPHLDQAKVDIKELEQQLAELEGAYCSCSLFFCENPKDSSEKFGEKMLKMLKAIQKQKADIRQKEERRRKQEEQAKKLQLQQ